MFSLSEIEHTLRLPPHLLSLPLAEAIKGELESLFLDKVIAKLGLCISVYDICSIDGGFVFPGDGASTYTVKFRLIIFRPFVGEVIGASLKESSSTGLCLSLGFFDDIYVPVSSMPHGSKYEPDPDNKKRFRWVWTYGENNLPIDGEDEIRFRVTGVQYPSIPLEQETDSKQSNPPEQGKDSNASVPLKQEKDSKPFAPMVLTGTLDADGLGPVSWWEPDE